MKIPKTKVKLQSILDNLKVKNKEWLSYVDDDELKVCYCAFDVAHGIY